MDVPLVPEENRAIYCYIYMIETCLREFIIEMLAAVAGPKWFKSRMPGNLLEKCRESVRFERQIKWTQFVPHHQLYYLDFPELKTIIVRTDNWSDAFEPIFKRQDIFVGTVSELEPIRNKIAHNRRATSTDLRIVEAAYSKLTQ